jgi:hypothetical protein
MRVLIIATVIAASFVLALHDAPTLSQIEQESHGTSSRHYRHMHPDFTTEETR